MALTHFLQFLAWFIPHTCTSLDSTGREFYQGGCLYALGYAKQVGGSVVMFGSRSPW